MRRREFITLLGGAVAVAPSAVSAQEAGRVYRLGFCTNCHVQLHNSRRCLMGCGDKVSSKGEILPSTLAVSPVAPSSIRKWQRKSSIPASTSSFAVAMPRIRAAQQVTRTIPIAGVADDMVGSGLVASLARPGGNTTGFSILSTELDSKRQELLIELVPGARRMAALFDPAAKSAAQLQEMVDAARARGVEISTHRVTKAEDIVRRHRCGTGGRRGGAQCAGDGVAPRQPPIDL